MKTPLKTLLAAGTALVLPLTAQAAEWTEVLVTNGDVKPVEMAEGRMVMTYYASGGVALLGHGKEAPGGSFECAGMIDAGADGMMLTLSCATTDANGDQVYSEVSRGKDSTMPPGQGVYSYTGGTGAWASFTADCTYAVHEVHNGQHVEFGHCEGPALPPPLQ